MHSPTSSTHADFQQKLPINASKQLAIACRRSDSLHRSGPWAYSINRSSSSFCKIQNDKKSDSFAKITASHGERSNGKCAVRSSVPTSWRIPTVRVGVRNHWDLTFQIQVQTKYEATLKKILLQEHGRLGSHRRCKPNQRSNQESCLSRFQKYMTKICLYHTEQVRISKILSDLNI